mmetsp:Transcript_87889/g.221713  ORF Transcript_87889/g.221713 Transcript_87889/m.221713 type:complete len:293 (-) Transcript_87889:86-964(-)
MLDTFAKFIITLSAASATGVKVEIYYGPDCPDSAAYLAMYVQPFLYANIPGVNMTVLPFIKNDPHTNEFPADCPGTVILNHPCAVLPAPMCAFQPWLKEMPAELTMEYKDAINFAICDVAFANSQAPATFTHTQADIDRCASHTGAEWYNISVCMADPVADEDFKAMMVAANAQVKEHRGKSTPFIFVDDELINNTQALLDAVCAKLPDNAKCAAAHATNLYEVELQVSRFYGAPQWLAWTGAVSTIVGVALMASRTITWYNHRNLRDQEGHSLVHIDELESPKEGAVFLHN